MAKRPKRTYNQATGQWETEKLWDHQDDQGFYWKDGVQVDSSGRPIYDAQGNEQGAAPADENNVTLNPTDQAQSQAELDYYASFDEEGNPTEATTISQEHLDEIQGGLGIEAGDPGFLTLDDIGNNKGSAKIGQSYASGREGVTKSGSVRRGINQKKTAPSILTRGRA